MIKTENLIKMAGQCTPPLQKIQDGWLRFDYDSSEFN